MRLICGHPILLVRVGIKVERARQWALRGFRPRRRVSQTAAKWPPIISQNDRRAPAGAISVNDPPHGDYIEARQQGVPALAIRLAQEQSRRARQRLTSDESGPPKPARHYWS